MSWPIIKKDEIPSTSILAQKLAENYLKAPFVVFADSQSRGRGQGGNFWQSPKGNLYTTFTFVKDDFPLELIPHKTVVLVCEWIYLKFSLRLTIKWPNDILFAGYKVSGILCENKIINSVSTIFVGIGLNINVAPIVEQSTKNQSTCLKSILGKTLCVEQCRRDLLLWMQQHWAAFSYQSLLSRYDFFYIGDDQPWYNIKERQLYYSLPMQPDGQLRLRCYEKNRERTDSLISSSHNYYWVFQQKNQVISNAIIVLLKKRESIYIGYFPNSSDILPSEMSLFCFESKDSRMVSTLHLLVRKTIRSFVYVLDEDYLGISRLLEGENIKIIKCLKRPVLSSANGDLSKKNDSNLISIEGKLLFEKIAQSRKLSFYKTSEIYLDILGLKTMITGGSLVYMNVF